MRATLIIIFIFPTIILNVKCLDSNNETSNKSDHKMSIAWSLHPIIGIVGTVLNSFVLYMFVRERQNMISLINLLILLDTLYRLAISLVGVPWKGFLLATDSYLFSPWLLSNQMVKSQQII